VTVTTKDRQRASPTVSYAPYSPIIKPSAENRRDHRSTSSENRSTRHAKPRSPQPTDINGAQIGEREQSVTDAG
jgi:hypothetical protein